MSDTDPMPESAAPTPESTPSDALIGQVLGGRYRVERLLGAGGMGSVYRAEHVHMRKAVALKILHREMTAHAEIVARFEREAVAAARIEHPHVAVGMDFGRLEDGAFYLVLEYVEGKSLTKLLREQKQLAPERALRITRQIAEALRAAHAAGIVHRDLKPDNVMLVEREGDTDWVKVLDFGIAKVKIEDSQEEQLTKMGAVFGTPEYMSPEQAQGANVDTRADLYTLGILLYEMLAGQSPFKDEDLIVVLTRQLTADPEPLPASVDPAVAELTMMLLAKQPDQRLQTADDVIQRIDALLGVSMTPSPVSIGQVARTEPDVVASSSTRMSVAAMSERASQFAIAARGAIERAMPEEMKSTLFDRRVRIAGKRVPVWALVAAATVVLVVASLIVGNLGDDQPTAAAPLPKRLEATRQNLDAELRENIEKAKTGDRAAIAQLQKRRERQRSAPEWLALAEGLVQNRQHDQAMHAYAGAVKKEAGLAKDPTVLGNVRQAAERSESSDSALRLAADGLGPAGADLLYDVWITFRRNKERQALAEQAKTLLDSTAVRKQATPALQIALDLHAARGCAAYKTLMPRAVEHADERSVALLRPLGATRGCGFLGLGDCYECLRRNKDLSDATRNAQTRPAPTFGVPAKTAAPSNTVEP